MRCEDICFSYLGLNACTNKNARVVILHNVTRGFDKTWRNLWASSLLCVPSGQRLNRFLGQKQQAWIIFIQCAMERWKIFVWVHYASIKDKVNRADRRRSCACVIKRSCAICRVCEQLDNETPCTRFIKIHKSLNLCCTRSDIGKAWRRDVVSCKALKDLLHRSSTWRRAEGWLVFKRLRTNIVWIIFGKFGNYAWCICVVPNLLQKGEIACLWHLLSDVSCSVQVWRGRWISNAR